MNWPVSGSFLVGTRINAAILFLIYRAQYNMLFIRGQRQIALKTAKVFLLQHIRLATECDNRGSNSQEPETSFKIVLGNRTLQPTRKGHTIPGALHFFFFTEAHFPPLALLYNPLKRAVQFFLTETSFPPRLALSLSGDVSVSERSSCALPWCSLHILCSPPHLFSHSHVLPTFVTR
jgi:hypothetical protein